MKCVDSLHGWVNKLKRITSAVNFSIACTCINSHKIFSLLGFFFLSEFANTHTIVVAAGVGAKQLTTM